MHLSSKFFVAALLLLSSFTVAASAQTKTAPKKTPAAQTAAAPAPEAETEANPEKFRQDFIRASEEYKASLQQLASTLEESFKRAEERHKQLVELYKDGLIARREIEESAQALEKSRAEIEGTRKEVTNVEATIAAAKNPPPPVSRPTEAVVASILGAEPVWTTGSAGIDGLIRHYGKRYGVDPYLIYCVMHQESSFRNGAVSHKGAQGLMQLMPGTAARYGVTNPYDPAQNIMGGTRYLRDLMRLFNGRVDLVLAGYNAGEGAVMKYGYRVPPYRETQNYVARIGSRYANKPGVTLTSKTAARKQKAKGSK
jgi:soluble lytic murein transglycosylase-like protein